MTHSVAHGSLARPERRGGWAGPDPRARKLARRGGMALLLLSVSFLFVAPVAMLVVGMLHNGPPGSGGTWSTDGLERTFLDPRTYVALQNSVIYALATTTLGTVIGTVFAFLAARTNASLRSWLNPVMLLVF